MKGMNFTKKEIKEVARKNRLLSVDLEFSKKCNLKCIYCYEDAGLAREKELNFEEIKKVIDEAADLGARVFSLIGGGEPLLYPRLLEIIDYIQEKRKEAIIFTNGILIDEELAEKLSKRKISIVTKLNSLKEEVQDELAGVKGTYKKIMNSLEILQKKGYGKEIELGIESIICSKNIDEIKKLWEWAKERNIKPYFEIMTLQGRANKKLEVKKEELKKLFQEIAELEKGKIIAKPPIIGMNCQRNKYSVTIKSNGDVQPCVGITINLGNIKEKPLKEILENEVIYNLRDNKIKGKCGKCENKEECYGCRGNAYNICEDYLAEDPYCWK